MTTPVYQRLYVRIWLAVVGTIALMTMLAGWLARMEVDHERAERPGREIVLRNAAGEVIGQAPARPIRVPGQGPEFQVPMTDGSTLFIQLPRPGSRIPGGPAAGPLRFPVNFAWMLGLMGLAVALGSYPVIRRLTKRLEALELGVRQWGEGDLSRRLPDAGADEVAVLAQGFNAAAQRVQALLLSHKALLANASHELRSPLTRIRMGLELMGPQTASSIKEEITRNIQELDQLVDEILLASRLDASEADLGTMEPVDMLGLMAEECNAVGVALDAPADSAGLVVHGVAKLLRRAVRNLLENALRHGASVVNASARRDGGSIVLAVADNGPGVPVHLRERIFEPFYRLPGASERDGGAGLGLALVKSIVVRHGGAVSCRAPSSPGACFEVRLPLQSGSLH